MTNELNEWLNKGINFYLIENKNEKISEIEKDIQIILKEIDEDKLHFLTKNLDRFRVIISKSRDGRYFFRAVLKLRNMSENHQKINFVI